MLAYSMKQFSVAEYLLYKEKDQFGNKLKILVVLV